MIGAVRSGGFLPWDDDADVIMTYDNWERFKAACQVDLPPDRHLGACDICETHTHVIPRYASTTTTSIHTCQSVHDDVAGEAIDIFVLDPISSKEEWPAYLQDMYLYSTFANYANVASQRVELDPELFKSYLDMEREHGRIYTAKKLEERLAGHFSREGEYFGYRWQGASMVLRREWFESAVMVPFEDASMPVPIGYNEYLTRYFGDEWYIVPDYITPAKHNAGTSLDFPYTTALDYYEPTFDREMLRKRMYERKVSRLEDAPLNNYLSDVPVRAKAALAAATVRKAVSESQAAFNDALASEDGNVLASILADFIDWQTSAEAIGRENSKGFYRYLHPVLADVSDEVFDGMLLALAESGRMRFVRRLVQVKRDQGIAVSAISAKLERAVLQHADARDLYHRGDVLHALDMAEGLANKFPRISAFRITWCKCLKARAAETGLEDDWETLRVVAQDGRDAFPSDGAYLKFLADCEARNNHDAAQKMYIQAAECTRDGYLLKEIADVTGYHPTWERLPHWAIEAGVPQWHGELPEPIDEDAEDVALASQTVAYDSEQAYLLKLLGELTAICDENGVDYIVSPGLARSMCVDAALPKGLGAYAIVVSRDGAQLLLRQLRNCRQPNREVEYMGNSVSLNDRSIRYCGLDSVLLDTKHSCQDRYSAMYITIVPIEPAEYSGKLGNELRKWGTKITRLTAPKTLKDTMLALAVKRFRANLFSKAMRSEATAERAVLDGRSVKLSESDLAAAIAMDFNGISLRVPRELDGYIASVSESAAGTHLEIPLSFICSSAMGYTDLVKSGAFDPGYFKKKNVANARNKYGNESLAMFRENFAQVRLAVQVKQFAHELLPEKERIHALVEAADCVGLREVLGAYDAFVNAHASVGNVVFDEDVFRDLLAYRKLAG